MDQELLENTIEKIMDKKLEDLKEFITKEISKNKGVISEVTNQEEILPEHTYTINFKCYKLKLIFISQCD